MQYTKAAPWRRRWRCMLTPAVRSYSELQLLREDQKNQVETPSNISRSPRVASRLVTVLLRVPSQTVPCFAGRNKLFWLSSCCFLSKSQLREGTQTRAVITWRTRQSSLYSPCCLPHVFRAASILLVFWFIAFFFKSWEQREGKKRATDGEINTYILLEMQKSDRKRHWEFSSNNIVKEMQMKLFKSEEGTNEILYYIDRWIILEVICTKLSIVLLHGKSQ